MTLSAQESTRIVCNSRETEAAKVTFFGPYQDHLVPFVTSLRSSKTTTPALTLEKFAGEGVVDGVDFDPPPAAFPGFADAEFQLTADPERP